MNLFNYYWYFENALSPKLCDDIIKYANLQQESLGLIGGVSEKANKGIPLNESDLKHLKKKRDSNIVWLNERWIYKEIHPYIHIANRNAHWNFEWNFSEAVQFTKYKLNQYYDWHTDSWNVPYPSDKQKEMSGKIRKLSTICVLSDKSDYEGGELEFQYRNKDDPNPSDICPHTKKRGTLIVFPSFIWHRVKPVTSGNRYSLVLWHLGAPFK
tara:strand:- start:68 stop:703 length:636 start_codon:yes stop_codon:yes gene_type:complete